MMDDDQLQPEDVSAEFEDSDSAVATIEQDVQEVPESPDTQPSETSEWTGPRCEKCEAPIKSDAVTICRSCGWYASLGTFVEVDPNWETEGDTGVAPAPAPKKSHLRVWIELLPRWSWVIIATLFAIFVESLLVRLVAPAGIRSMWSCLQLLFGVLAFIFCHIFNFVVLAADDADFGVLDMLLKPLKLWIRALHELPKRLWVSNMAASAVWAALMSILVIGAIPYERFWDWGFDAPVKQELMAAVMDRAKQLENRNGADNLEDAIGDFAGTADGLTDTPEPEKPRHKADCVILGYQLDKEDRLSALVLGTTNLGQLVHAGTVELQMSGSERSELLRLLSSIKTMQPLIPIESDRTYWVKPKYTCRVTYTQKDRGRLSEMEFDKLLGTIQMK